MKATFTFENLIDSKTGKPIKVEFNEPLWFKKLSYNKTKIPNVVKHKIK